MRRSSEAGQGFPEATSPELDSAISCRGVFDVCALPAAIDTARDAHCVTSRARCSDLRNVSKLDSYGSSKGQLENNKTSRLYEARTEIEFLYFDARLKP